MAIHESQYVRHRTKPEWGVGKVEGIRGDNLFIRFVDQLRTIKMSFAEQLLEPATAAEFQTNRPAGRAGPAVGRTVPCTACGKALNSSRRSAEGTWKSCANCSARDGAEHIFYRYPEGFGEIDERASGEDPVGAPSWCLLCKAGGAAPDSSARRCGDLRATAVT